MKRAGRRTHVQRSLSTFRAGEPSSGYAPFPGPERGECHYRLIPDGRDHHISGTVEFMHFPLDIANPFIPDDMAKMGGDLDGTLAISGQSDKPMAEGYLILDTASVYVGAAGSTFRFDDKKIEIKNNRILFNQYGIYAYNKNPFIINGEVDFNDLSRMTANLKLTANNLQLLNVKKNEESLVYGKSLRTCGQP